MVSCLKCIVYSEVGPPCSSFISLYSADLSLSGSLKASLRAYIKLSNNTNNSLILSSLVASDLYFKKFLRIGLNYILAFLSSLIAINLTFLAFILNYPL